jgi:hypothetical protein
MQVQHTFMISMVIMLEYLHIQVLLLDDRFGYSVAVGSGRIVVGAYSDDIGIGLTNAGSAHIYKINENIDTYYEEILDNYKY